MAVHLTTKKDRPKNSSTLGHKKYGVGLDFRKARGSSILGHRKINSSEILHEGRKKNEIREKMSAKD